MRRNIKKIVVFVGFIALVSHAFAQKQSDAILKAATKEYNALRYAYAIPLLERSLKQQPANVEAMQLLAQSYLKTKDYQNAAAWYAKLVQQNPIKAEWALNYAEVLANLEDYQTSQIWYKKYLTLKNGDARAADFLNIYPNVSSFMANKARWKIGFANINTNQAEYAPIYYGDGLLFVSNRKTNGFTKNVFAWDQSPFSDLYLVDKLEKVKSINIDSVMLAAKTDKNLQKKFYVVNNDDTRKTSNDSKTFADSYATINDTLARATGSEELATRLSKSINSKYHEGPVALLPDGTMMFTRNNYFNGKTRKSTDGVIKLKMFTANSTSMDNLKPFAYNSDEYSIGHPALNSAGTLLIFTSDMPGGFGGTDLYYSTRASLNDEWSKPINMGKAVNTEGDEMFPTLYQDKQLFFSSTGHAGLGGLDIFELDLDGFTPQGKPKNLGAPVNSSVDDFSLIRDGSGSHGFFSSNRRGNDDIYMFAYNNYKIILKGKLTEQATGNALANINIIVEHSGQRLTIKTDAQGNYEYELPQNAVTKLDFVVPRYEPKQFSLSTEEILTDTTINKNIALKTLGSVNQQQNISAANPCDTFKKLVTEFVLYYDLDKSDIRKDAAEVADKLAIFLKANPQFEVAAASYCDSRASKEYNIRLSQRRSNAVKNYLINKGISSNRISISFYGEENLVNHCADGVNCSEEEQQLNRRTEFFLLYKGKKIEDLDCETLQKLK